MKRFTILVAAAAALMGFDALAAQQAEYEAQVSKGEVELEARPEWSEGRMMFDLSANTHTVDLGALDLTKAIRLVVGQQEYAPVQTGSLGGHHARTTVVFEVPQRPARFDLVVRDVPDVPLRRLTWPAGD